MVLSVHHVYKSYGKERVLNDITFEIEKPCIVALIGPNGAGKSTLLSIITNLLTSDQGSVTVLNKSNKNPEIFREISFMQDNTVLYDYLTGYDHLQFIGDIQKISKTQILETAERVGMEKYLHKRVGKYSLGMKQHLLLTMALVNNPKLLILDEPLNGLDPTSAIRVRNLLLDLYKSGTAILLSSHNLGEIDRVTSRILFLKNGRLIQEDISQHEKTYYKLLVDDVKKAKACLERESFAVKVEQNTLIVHLAGSPISKLFQVIEQQNITLLDIEKVVLGSEDRYQMIFGTRVN